MNENDGSRKLASREGPVSVDRCAEDKGYFTFRGITKSGRVRGEGPGNEARGLG